MAVNDRRPVGKGRTLEEAFDDYAEQKVAELLDSEQLKSASRVEIQEFFRGDGGRFPVDIAVELVPHNQWVRGYIVTDR